MFYRGKWINEQAVEKEEVREFVVEFVSFWLTIPLMLTIDADHEENEGKENILPFS